MLTVGVIYDIYGRRKPFLAAWTLASVGLFIYPWNDNLYIYFLINTMMVPLTSVFTLPFIPDLFVESS